MTACQARNGRVAAFERIPSSKQPLGQGADYELGKSAWNASSRIWGTSKSLLEARVDSEPIRRMLGPREADMSTDRSLASPIRQGSVSSYGQSKTASSSLLTSIDLNDENASQSKMPWAQTSSTIGFPSRQRGQPLSPTKQRQNQMLDFAVSGNNGGPQESSLFAGSAPDVEETSFDGPHLRRAITAGPRVLPSPSRASTFGRNQVDAQAQVFNSNAFHSNGIFASLQEFEDGQGQPLHGLSAINGTTDVLPLHDSHGVTREINGMTAGNLSRYNPVSPTYAKRNGRLLNAEHVEQYHPSSKQKYDETVRALELLNFDQGTAQIAPVRKIPSQYQRDIHHGPIQASSQSSAPFHPMESNFQPPIAHVPDVGSRLDPQAAPHYGGFQYGGRGNLPSLQNEYRSSLNSPYYSTTGTPPTGPHSIRSTPGSGASSRTSHHDPFMFDRKFTNVEIFGYDQAMYAPASLQAAVGNGFQYDTQMPVQPMRMNPLAHPYIGNGHSGITNYPAGPRMPIREPDQSHIVRSPLLEEFRMNSKTNRRFELKDIYNYVVEFSGDQHGSRFIQQKLETANSDEKEQIFKEIQPNLLQLMTDVFGNYVIQKMFEHGNQTQKKILAHQMKGHVLHLSMQMYGCRVVQKAFEHVLTDQQASLVKELDGPNLQILKVVKDQNGNHVVQKAIERIPGEHIQFIVDAHRGQMAKMSTHQYGCRVVQRMLEHCQPQAKRVILDELLEHILPLISDSYGNYVVQHIIQNGEPQDRRQVVNIVLQQLLAFSKHKFASNIVEKSIDCADEDQRAQILRGLTAPNEQGVSPVLGLMRDQYGNYVLQKVFGQLQGSDLLALRADMEQNYPVLRRTSYGKQVTAIEKLLFGGNGPSTTSTASSRSSTLPSTNASSTVDGETPPSHPSDIK
ncbi:Pumilio-family RNA binding repeat-containing protein isoform 4 [Cladophialophora immunda]|nr:Pumilio-family RNA binding repeat-containing protein isoform 4 [Cladophialophora immunda]